MNKKIDYWFVVLVALFVVSCNSGGTTNRQSGPPAYFAINETSCNDSVGINGKWQLVKVYKDEKNITPSAKEILVIKDCSILEYYSSDHLVRRDSFKLFKVLNYCTDYQLNYLSKNDSISCINMRKDTLIFGECSAAEGAKFFYKKL